MKNRDLSFDFAKGVLIFLVVLGHILQYHTTGCFEDNPLYLFIYSFHMPAFFLISGYFASKALNQGFWQCVNKKMSRYAIPALIWSLFALVFYYYCYMRELPLSKIVVSSFRTTWFLWSLSLFYVMASLIWKCRYKYYITIVLCILLWFTHRWQNPYIFDYLHISREFPCFMAGLMYKEFLLSGKKLKMRWRIMGLIIASIIYVTEFYRYCHDLGGYQTRCILLLSGGIVFLSLIKVSYNYFHIFTPPLPTLLIVKIGGASMGVYLIDSIAKEIIEFFWDVHTTNYYILLGAALLFTLVYYCLTILVRKNNFFRKYLLGE